MGSDLNSERSPWFSVQVQTCLKMIHMILMIPQESCPIAACKHSTDFKMISISTIYKTVHSHSGVRTVTDLDDFVCPRGEQPAPGWFILHMYDAVLTVMKCCSGCPSGQSQKQGNG